MYTIRSGHLFDLWHALPFRQLPSTASCAVAVALKVLDQKEGLLVT